MQAMDCDKNFSAVKNVFSGLYPDGVAITMASM
jgi:hypothetical protein